HDRIGSERAEDLFDDRPVREVALRDADASARDLLPRGGATGQVGQDRRQGVRARIEVGPPPEVVIDDMNLVTPVREPHRGRPPEVSITAQDEDAHVRTLRGWESPDATRALGCFTSAVRPNLAGPGPPRRGCGSGR